MAFFSGAGAFFGGILFLTRRVAVMEKGLASRGKCDERWMGQSQNIIQMDR
jgi:hypothetical protein